MALISALVMLLGAVFALLATVGLHRFDLIGAAEEGALQALLEQSGQPRLIRAHEVANVIRDLCFEEASSRSGELVVLDGSEPS